MHRPLKPAIFPPISKTTSVFDPKVFGTDHYKYSRLGHHKHPTWAQATSPIQADNVLKLFRKSHKWVSDGFGAFRVAHLRVGCLFGHHDTFHDTFDVRMQELVDA